MREQITKPANVVMLATENKSNLHLVFSGEFEEKNGKLIKIDSPRLLFTKESTEYGYPCQHLYFTTNEEIKEGDFFIVELFKITGLSDGSHLEQCRSINDVWVNEGKVDEVRHINNCKKIVATTNPDLWIKNPNKPNFNSYISFSLGVSVPKIDISFVEAYVREQGKIDKVLLEYEEYLTDGWIPSYNNPDNRNLEDSAELDERLKLKPNGSVIVHPVKEKTYTRDEVEELCKQAWDQADENAHGTDDFPMGGNTFKYPTFQEWIKNILQ